jgi:NAD(P)H-quinone oxidoreductase subunit I
MDVSRDEDRKLQVDYIGIDFGLCIFCGLCIESCPPGNAIYLSRSYERVTYRCTTIQNEGGITSSDKRCRELYIENDNLTEIQAKQKSAYFRPELYNKLPKQTLLLEQNSHSQNANKKEQWQ